MSETDVEKLGWLHREIQKGLDDLESGRFRDGLTMMAAIREKLHKLKADQERGRASQK